MEENHLNRNISVNPDGRLCIDNQTVDSDMILFEEEAKNLLEQELMEGPHFYYTGEEDELIPEDDDPDIILEDDQNQDDENYLNGGYHDISNDEFDT